MGTTSLTAGEVMDKSASLMNDTAKTVYTYTVQIPYLNMALAELQEHFQLNNIPVTSVTSAGITVPIGTTEIGPVDGGVGETTAPNYPTDLIEIQQLWERLSGSEDPYVPLVKKEYLPHFLDDMPVSSLLIWAWVNQQIKFVGATTARQVKIDYIKAIFAEITSEDDEIGVINAQSFLMYRTAALCTQFIGENESRASALNDMAVAAADRVTGIGVKGKQSITIRRRPFRQSYKARGYF